MTLIQGLIAHENVETVDQRVISDVDWYHTDRIPLIYLTDSNDSGETIGWFEVMNVVGDMVVGRGECDWPEPGVDCLEVGIDLDRVETDPSDGDPIQRIVGGRLRAVAAYATGGKRKAAWPFVRIWKVHS